MWILQLYNMHLEHVRQYCLYGIHHRRGGVVVERLPRMREIVVRSQAGTNLCR